MRIRLTFIPLLLLLLVTVACGSGDDSAGSDTDPETQPTLSPVPPTETPVPTSPPPEPTVAPTEAAVEPTLVPETGLVEYPNRVGILRIRDSEAGPATRFALLADSIPAAPAGSHYELWFLDDSGAYTTAGSFGSGAEGFTGTTDLHIVGNYAGAEISLETDGATVTEPSTVVYAGLLPFESLVHIRHVTFAIGQTPDGQGFLPGAFDEHALAVEHTGLLNDALADGDLDEARRHAEHVINILVGESDERFGDLDGDGLAQNPGDGFGLRGYLEGAAQHAALAASANGASKEVDLHSEHVVIASDNALMWLDETVAAAVRVLSSDSTGEAQESAEAMTTLLALVLDGQDLNGDGAVAPVVDEGGMLTAYEHALNMAGFEIVPAGEVVAAPEPEPTPVPEPTDAPPAPVIVDMVNFVYVPKELTIPAGTTVTWTNSDSATQAQHSATDSNGLFDTGLYDPGQEASFTFTDPGVYTIYCTLHGAANGTGMASTITVE